MVLGDKCGLAASQATCCSITHQRDSTDVGDITSINQHAAAAATPPSASSIILWSFCLLLILYIHHRPNTSLLGFSSSSAGVGSVYYSHAGSQAKVK